MSIISIAPVPTHEQTSSVVLVAIVAAGPERLTPLLRPYLPGTSGCVVIFDAASYEAPLLPGFKVELFGATLGKAEKDEAELIRHSLPGLFSLRQPTDTLREIFPGLREIERRSVPQLAKKLSPEGLICFDDTWTDEAGFWTAKGATAMPFLLENGFTLVEARNRAALLRRKD